MPRVHFLNVRNGDCSIIQHMSGRISVIDVNRAFIPIEKKALRLSVVENYERAWNPVPGNYDQKSDEDNPIVYLRKLKVQQIFRFILTHPDMDHLGGIKGLFTEFTPNNFWDTANTKEFADGSFGSRTELKTDWEFYKYLRDTKTYIDINAKRVVYYSGNKNEYYKSDGLQILAPTKALVEAGNKRRDWNDASYVILYFTQGKKILFSGDSEDKTWEYLLTTWPKSVSNLDILIAPHHGRHSGRSYEFLQMTKPKLTLYGNAASDHLAYKPWHNRGLTILTNNQAGYVILEIDSTEIAVYAKNKTYAENLCEENGRKTRFNEELDAWFLGAIHG